MLNIFKNKKILILKKKKKSFYYDLLIKGIIKYGIPKKVFFIEYDSSSNIFDINKNIKKLIVQNKIDIFIITSFYFVDPEFLKSIQGKVFRIKIDGDDLALYDVYSKFYSKFYDLNITNTVEIHNKFKANGCNSLIYASPVFNNYLKKKKLKRNKKYEVSFIGLIRNQRVDQIKLLKKNKIAIQCFGENQNSSFLSQKKYFDTIKNTKINLNLSSLSHNFDEIFFKKKKISKLKNMQGRIFEVLSCKCFLLTEYNSTLSHFFKPGRDFEVFKTNNELLKKIKFYLKNNKSREKIANHGYKTFIKKYEFKKYMPNFINQISSFRLKTIKIDKVKCPKEVRIFFTEKYVSIKLFLQYEFYLSIFKYFDVSLILKKFFKKFLRI